MRQFFQVPNPWPRRSRLVSLSAWVLALALFLGITIFGMTIEHQSLNTSYGLAQPANTPTSSLQALEYYRQQLQQYYDNALTTQGQLEQWQTATQGSLIQLQGQLATTEQNLKETEFRLQVAQQFLTLLQRDWGRAQQDYQTLQNQVVRRLRWLQQQPKYQGWASLLQSDNLAQMFQKRHRIRLLYEADLGQLKRVQASFAVLQQRRFDIENQKNEIALMQERLRFERAKTQNQVATQTALAERLKHDRLALDAALTRLEQDSARLGQLIRSRPQTPNQGNSLRIRVGGSGRLIVPVNGPVSSEFGWRVHPIAGTERLHTGMDFAVDYGTPILSAAAGQVIFAGWYGGYGNAVIVDHGGGITTLYAHASELFVQEGDGVSQGNQIASVGSTGYSTGPHLHFEVRLDGEPVDPRQYL